MDKKLFSEKIIEKIDKQYNIAMNRCPKRMTEVNTIFKNLNETELTALKFTYGFMPISDVISYDVDLILSTIRQAVKTYETIDYVKSVPTELFLNYILFYRVNNENIENYREEFYNELFPLIQAKSMKEAAIEVNYWCFQKATYQATDERTASPKTVICRALGRCGEESTLTVSAMRSVGIPARQCYTPRWAHCDDNHAWVEVWADGKWCYMGACEPEPVLNKGWFTAAASKAMLVHSKAFSDMVSDELVASKTPVFSTINNTATYGKCKKITIKVIENNKPLEGINVRFELVNYGELFPIFTAVTDKNGIAEFNSGLGDLHIHAHDSKRFITKIIDVRQSDAIVLDFEYALDKGSGIVEYEMTPPLEDILSLEDISEEKKLIHMKRCEMAEKIRTDFEASFYKSEERLNYEKQAYIINQCLIKSKGNYIEIQKFIKDLTYNSFQKADILSTLTEKDYADITCELLYEYLEASKPYELNFPKDIYRNYILAPRIQNEMIVSTRPFIKAFFDKENIHFENPIQIMDYINDKITLMDKYDYGTLCADVKGILNYKIGTTLSNKILFVSICRTFGFPARLNPINGEKEYYQNGRFISIDMDILRNDNIISNSKLTIINDEKHDLNYFCHISIAKLVGAVYNTLQFWDKIIKDKFEIEVSAGNYRVLSVSRQIDGCVLVREYYLDILENENKKLKVSLIPDRIMSKLKYSIVPDTKLIPLTKLENLIKPTTLYEQNQKNNCVLIFTEPGKEPTEHLFNEIIDLKDNYNSKSIEIILVVRNETEIQNKTFQKLLLAVPKCKVFLHNDDAYAHTLHKIMGVGDERNPFVIVMDKSNIGLFAFANYNVGTANTILSIINATMS